MGSSCLLIQENIAIHELLGSGDFVRIEAMLTLFGQLFPQYVQYIPRMRHRANFPCTHNPKFVTHYWLLEVDGQPAGLRTFRYVRSRRCGLAHSLAIDPNYRKQQVNGLRLSMFLVQRCLQQIVKDAEMIGDRPIYGMVNEVEADRLMQHYLNNGLIKLPVSYQEPIFPDSFATVEEATFAPMYLGFLPLPGNETISSKPELLKEFVLAFLVDHYGLPEAHPVVQSVLQSIDPSRN